MPYVTSPLYASMFPSDLFYLWFMANILYKSLILTMCVTWFCHLTLLVHTSSYSSIHWQLQLWTTVFSDFTSCTYLGRHLKHHTNYDTFIWHCVGSFPFLSSLNSALCSQSSTICPLHLEQESLVPFVRKIHIHTARSGVCVCSCVWQFANRCIIAFYGTPSIIFWCTSLVLLLRFVSSC